MEREGDEKEEETNKHTNKASSNSIYWNFSIEFFFSLSVCLFVPFQLSKRLSDFVEIGQKCSTNKRNFLVGFLVRLDLRGFGTLQEPFMGPSVWETNSLKELTGWETNSL
jgi:hypothetical protein